MNKLKKKLVVLTGLMAFCSSVFSQAELTLPYLEDVYQSSYTRPTALPESKVSIGLPGLSSIAVGATNSGFSFNDALIRTDTGLVISMGQAINELDNKNYLYAGTSIDLFHLQTKVKNFYFSVNAVEHVKARFSYPREMIKFPWEGNGSYIGKKINWQSLDVDAMHYREYGLGVVYSKPESPWVIGGRFKVLSGMANVNIENKELGVETSSDMYQLDVVADGRLNMNLPISLDEGGGDEIDPVNYLTNFKNMGYGVDLGVEYQFRPWLKFSVSAINLGYIRWKSNPVNYSLKGESSFEGFDPVQEFYENETNLDDYADSIANQFDIKETAEGYTTWLTPQFYATAEWNVLEHTRISGSVFLEPYKKLRPAFTLAVDQEIGRLLTMVLSYNMMYRSYNNFGFGFMFKPGPVQLYFVGDNLFSTWTKLSAEDTEIYAPMNMRTVNFRFGINLVFGWRHQPDKLIHPEDL